MTGARVAVLGLALGLQGQAAPFAIGLWPGEGRPRLVARRAALAVRVEPSGAAAVAETLRVRAGAALAFDETRLVTVRPGRAVALRAGSVTGTVFGRMEYLSADDYYGAGERGGGRSVAAGSVVEILAPRAEGACIVRVAGQVMEAEICPGGDPEAFRVESQPVTEWWVRVARSGGPPGWLLVDRVAVTVAVREF